MLHTIRISENDLKKLVAKNFFNCKPEMGQLGEKIVYAMITKEEEI